MNENALFLVALLASGAFIYALTLLGTHLLRTRRRRLADAAVAQTIKRLQRKHRQKMDQRFNRPWFNYTTDRLHKTISYRGR